MQDRASARCSRARPGAHVNSIRKAAAARPGRADYPAFALIETEPAAAREKARRGWSVGLTSLRRENSPRIRSENAEFPGAGSPKRARVYHKRRGSLRPS